ncbi:MAG: ATP-binding protein [Bacteroidetes bacterium]|nr:ATP-binding protein [Bacteroidota bacterium]
MSDYEEILRLVKRGEDQQLDFKQSISSLSKIAKTIVSFANTDGGLLVVGVDDKGEIIGVDTNQEKFMLIKAARQFCDPVIFLYFTILSAKKVNVLLAEVKKSKRIEHLALDNNGNWLPYVRVKDQTIVVPGLEEQLKADKHNLNPIPILMEKHKDLVSYLDENECISIKDYMKLMNISYNIANRSLRELKEADVLEEELINNVSLYFLRSEGI